MIRKYQDTHNFLWLDLEMTGLNVSYDVIMEIATVITDSNLQVIAQGPSLVIGYPESTIVHMHNNVKSMHILNQSSLMRLDNQHCLLKKPQHKPLIF
ncbi:TPA: hypothetical protein ENS27_05455 [bacterium]|jgi:oligoribonuclease|nr:hypothetical protein [bacterium]